MLGVGFVYGFMAGAICIAALTKGGSILFWLVWLATLDEDDSFATFTDTEDR